MNTPTASLQILLFLQSVLGADKSVSVDSVSDFACGSRAVQFVLDSYEQPTVDLVDLITEIQGGEVSSGASLDAMAKALEVRGIYVKSIKLPKDCCIHWDSPVILHLTPPEGRKIGHFVVLTEVSHSVVRVWNGMNGYETGDVTEFSKRLSGYALITSNQPISMARVNAALQSPPLLSGIAAIALPLGLLVSLIVIIWRRKA